MTDIFNTELFDELSTLSFGAAIALACTVQTTIYLHGDLGIGKTTFARGFIQSLGYKGRVKSPTYTLVEPYQLSAWQVYHFDLYRLTDPEELEFMGIRDYFTQNALCLVEWSNRGVGFLPEPDLDIILKDNGKRRRLKVKINTLSGRTLVDKLVWN
ncbi:tRNA (adenosine(37)-N6)-threonylcarbamoyltransferase complex ATPase subunit type 1 TsaE [Candidatus Enterovibrio escicola]|uniref:tRNA threonylcarbamoyladenosine biosynthesis protein TsaE n=1 Tax=Candidatus Enterovibrio escicola TaxID=1927127 RepID=A0A2A5T3E3_9GAMM|nr:tRNA (adenosine(37)-N6)-threonylcarbamoyltransferase complex ATPase subunit type 1 TsaE [Candidatus Enterovibrio escacola]PCS22676.1 TsaE protein [Candidatus Enterovibrio escacola]